MNIILEGPDGGGKSTFAEHLTRHGSRFYLQQGSGPPKGGVDEINERARIYLGMTNTIFDRHPCVSQPIYDTLRGGKQPIDQGLVDRLYASDSLFIYFKGDISRHVVKEGEDPQHIRTLTERYMDLCEAYDRWATQHAHLIYRIGDRTSLATVYRTVWSL